MNCDNYKLTTNCNNYEFNNYIYTIVKNTLISLNNSIITEPYITQNSNNFILKSIVNFNIFQLIDIILITIYKVITIEIITINNLYYILLFKYINTNDIILTLYLFISSNNYLNNYNNFDCNSIIVNYTGYNIIKNLHKYFKYIDIIYRINNKKFCYISNNLYNIKNILLDEVYINNNSCFTISKLFHAIKLVKNGWIMDEYVLKDKSWTINYHNTYNKYLSYIKFNNLSNITEEHINTCNICKNKFNNTDIVFNMDNIFVHFTCLFSLLIRK